MVTRNSMLEVFEESPRKRNYGRTPGKTSVYCTVCREVIWGPDRVCYGCRLSRERFLNEIKPESVTTRNLAMQEWKYAHRPMELATIWGRNPWW